MPRQHLILSKAQYMERTLFLGHRTRYSLSGPPWMEYLRGIIDHPGRKKIILAGRQVGKSAMCAAEACTEIASEDDFTVLYGTVDNNKLKNFTNQKLDPMVLNSPLIRRHFLSGKAVKDNVTDKRFANGSMIMIRNAKLEQNLRSPSTDSLKLDEIQDMLADNVYIGVKSMFTSPHKLVALYGTPRSFQNIIQGYFEQSTQNEWMVPCDACTEIKSTGGTTAKTRHWNRIGPRNVTSSGLVCVRCGSPIAVRRGEWVRMFDGMEYEGFRVPEPLSPFTDYTELTAELENPLIPEPQKMNEIFGLSWDTADRWLTETELREACAPRPEDRFPLKLYESPVEMPPEVQGLIRNQYVVAGCDWSLNLEGGAETVLFIGVVGLRNELMPVFAERIPKNLSWDEQVAYIGERLKEFQVNLFAGDVGAAGNRNVQIAEALGRNKVVQIEWGAGKVVREKFRNDVRVLSINRTMAFSDLKTDLVTKGEIRLPVWEDFSRYAQDFLVVTVEEDRLGRLKYDHPVKSHDDAVHALIYANIARKIVLGVPIHHLVADAEEE